MTEAKLDFVNRNLCTTSSLAKVATFITSLLGNGTDGWGKKVIKIYNMSHLDQLVIKIYFCWHGSVTLLVLMELYCGVGVLDWRPPKRLLRVPWRGPEERENS